MLWDVDRERVVRETELMRSGNLLVAARDGSAAFITAAGRNSAEDTRHLVTMLLGSQLSDMTVINGTSGEVTSLLYHDHVLYLAQADGRISRWQLGPEVEHAFLPDLGRWSPRVSALAASADGRLIAVGDRAGVVDVFDTVSGARQTYDPLGARPPVPTFGDAAEAGSENRSELRAYGRAHFVEALQFEGDGYALWIGYAHGMVHVIEPISMTVLSTDEPSERLRGGFDLDSTGDVVAAVGGHLLRWAKAKAPEQAFDLGARDQIYDDIAVDPDSGILAVIADNQLRTFEVDGRFLSIPVARVGGCVVPIGGGVFLATTSHNSFIRIEAKSGAATEVLKADIGYIGSVCTVNGRRAAFGGSDNKIVIFELDGRGGIVRSQVHEMKSLPAALAWIEGTALLAVGGGSAQVEFLDANSGDVSWRLANLGHAGWVFFDPDAYFDAPGQNWQDIGFTHPHDRKTAVANGPLLMARLTPGLFELALDRPDSINRNDASVTAATSHAPRITFLAPAPSIELSASLTVTRSRTIADIDEAGHPETFQLIEIGTPEVEIGTQDRLSSTAPVEVRIRVKDAGSGIGACRLLRDRQVVNYFEAPPASSDATVHVADVDLRPGVSELSAYCFTRDGVPGLFERITVATEEPSGPSGTAYVIAVGINAYKDERLELKYATADAIVFGRTVANALEESGVYDRIVRVDLTDTNATRVVLFGIFDLLAGQASDDARASAASGLENVHLLQEVTAEDAVIVFFAGHGEMRDNVYRILLYDYAPGFANTGIATDADFRHLFQRLDAAHLMLVIDACHAGGAIGDGGQRLGPFNSGTFAQMAYDKGVFFLGAALERQLAIEDVSLEHGLLTHALVKEGLLLRRADRFPLDAAISAREFLEFPLTRVPALHEETRRHGAAPSASHAASPLRNFELVGAETGVVQTPRAHIPGHGFKDDFVLARWPNR